MSDGSQDKLYTRDEMMQARRRIAELEGMNATLVGVRRALQRRLEETSDRCEKAERELAEERAWIDRLERRALADFAGETPSGGQTRDAARGKGGAG